MTQYVTHISDLRKSLEVLKTKKIVGLDTDMH